MWKMKEAICLSVLLAATFSAYAAYADEPCKKIVATGHPEYPAMAFKEGSHIAGAAPLLVGEIAQELDVPFEAKYMGSWSEAQSAIRAGKADMIIGVYYNEERSKYLDYVQPPFAYDQVVVFVASDMPFEFKGQDDLVGKKGVANEGESFGTTFDAFLKDKLTVTRVDGLRAAFEALLSGQADYVIAPYYPGTAQLVRQDKDDKIVSLEPPLLSEELFVAFSKTSPCAALAPKFGAGITEMTEDGRFRDLVDDVLAEWGVEESAQE
jgi:polar amino acid transport system substrate-binding protein